MNLEINTQYITKYSTQTSKNNKIKQRVERNKALNKKAEHEVMFSFQPKGLLKDLEKFMEEDIK